LSAIILAAALAALVWLFALFLKGRPGEGAGRTELLALSSAAAAALVSVAGLLLGFAGVFSLPALLGALAVAGILLLALVRRSSGPPGARYSGTRVLPGGGVPFLLLVAAALLLNFRPHWNTMGNWDPGVYLAQGAGLAGGGSLRLADTASPLLMPEEKAVIYPLQRGFQVKHPGFFVSAGGEHRLDPQFYPLYPVWIAVFTLMGGTPAAFYVSSLFSLLSLLLLVGAARELAGGRGAMAAGFLFLLNPFQVWFSGFQTAEIPMQTFFLAGLWAWLLHQRTQESVHAFLAGLFFALTAFASVTGLLLAPFMGFLHAFGAGRRRNAAAFFLSWLPLLPLSLWQNTSFTSQYFAQVKAILFNAWGVMPRAGAFLAAAALLVFLFVAGGRKERVALSFDGGKVRVFYLLSLVVLAAAATALYSDLFGQGRIQLAAALSSKSSLLAAMAGFLLLLRNRPAAALPLGALALMFTWLFSGNLMMVARFPWAAKRFLAVTLPLVCLGSGVVWERVFELARKQWIRVLMVLLVAAFCLRPLYRGRDFAFHRDRKGLPAFVERLAEKIPADGVVFAPRWLGPPLEFLHDKRVVPLSLGVMPEWERSPYPDVAARLGREGWKVYVVADEKTLENLPLAGVSVYRESLATSVLDQSRRPPSGAVREKRVTVEIVQLR
jgi:hypothetical protein